MLVSEKINSDMANNGKEKLSKYPSNCSKLDTYLYNLNQKNQIHFTTISVTKYIPFSRSRRTKCFLNQKIVYRQRKLI